MNRPLRAAMIGCFVIAAALIGEAPQTTTAPRSQTVARSAGTVPYGVHRTRRALVIQALNPKDASQSESDFDDIGPDAADSVIRIGLKNAGRLLPVVKEFTIEALHRTAVSVGLPKLDLAEAEQQISAVDSIVLDNALYDWAEVDLDQPSIIRVGVVYAFYLSGNEEAVFLLGHELAHVAAWSSGIDRLSDSVSTWTARVATDSNGPTTERSADDEKENLMCDFIGAQALKLYMYHYPSSNTVEDRIAAKEGGKSLKAKV